MHDNADFEQAVADAIDQAHRDYFGNVLWTHDAAAAAIRVVQEENRKAMVIAFSYEATNGDRARGWALRRAMWVLQDKKQLTTDKET